MDTIEPGEQQPDVIRENSENSDQMSKVSAPAPSEHDWAHHKGIPEDLLDKLFDMFKVIHKEVQVEKQRATLKAQMSDPIADMLLTPEQLH